ncbi:hypothetical protein [Aquibacillus sediminis]|uniref:hypothetical protein n=1 Tax=Aquibacillus sediminis TaxID=2574734 RepID=UPI0011096DD5|nr:hypothetical protein [Aquibacillus sediminis]
MLRIVAIGLLVLLVACNTSPQTQPNQSSEQENPYKQLSTNQQNQENNEENDQVDLHENNGSDDEQEQFEEVHDQNQASLQQSISDDVEVEIEEKEAQDSESQQDTEAQDTESQQDTEAQDSEPQQDTEDQDAEPQQDTETQDETESQSDQQGGEETTDKITTKLPFDDFQQRWNAVSDEQLSNLYIRGWDKTDKESEEIYRTKFRENLELNVHVQQGFIQSIGMVNHDGRDKDSVFSMLTGWTQIINILHPEMEIYDIDSILSDIGVGPNGDLRHVKTSTFTYEDVDYHVTKDKDSYQLYGIYQEDHSS